MAAAGGAGSALGIREERGTDTMRLLALRNEQEPQIRGAIERSRRDHPGETHDLPAFARDEEQVAFPEPFEKARPSAAERHAVALEKG